MSKQFTALHSAVSAYLNLLGYNKQARGLVFPYVRAFRAKLQMGNCTNNVHVYCIYLNTHFTYDANYYHSWRGFNDRDVAVIFLNSWLNSSIKYMYNYIPYLGYDDKS